MRSRPRRRPQPERGHEWLALAGRFRQRRIHLLRSEERTAFRGTEAHNTLRIDGGDQAVPDEPFSWTKIPTTRVENWVTGKTFGYFSGGHDGYERLPDPVTHQRSVLRVNGEGGIWLIRDIALGATKHDLELNWHFAGDIVVREAAPSEFVASRPQEPNQKENQSWLRLIIPTETEWRSSILQGRVSPAYGRQESAPVLRCTARVTLPAEIATALFAEDRAGASASTPSGMSMLGTQEASVQIYELRNDVSHHTFFFARGKQPWSSGPWSSDAEVLYCRIENESLVHLIVIGGSSAAWQGEPLLNAGGAFSVFRMAQA